ncbi:MAG: HAMP domain-containing protein [Rhodocyclaceae bacterium]|nr:MAG: HAMP domain-containing protein [Rhodocyclaceae bacterium]
MTGKMKVSQRKALNPRHILIGLGVPIIILLFLNISNIRALQELHAETQLLYQNELLPISHIKEANTVLFDIERHLKRMLITQSPVGRFEAKEAVINGEQSLDDELALAAGRITLLENIERMSSIQKLYSEYKTNVAQAISMIEREKLLVDNPADLILGESFQKVITSTDKLFDQIVVSKLESASERVERSRILHQQLQMLVLATFLVTLIAGVTSILVFRSLFVRPLECLRKAADQLSTGNFDVAVPHTKLQTTVGKMARAINRIQEAFRAMDSRLRALANAESASRSTIERAVEPSVELRSSRSPTRPADPGSQTSPLCRTTHEYLNALGESLCLRGQLGEAEMPLRSALVLIPSSASALVNLAETQVGRGQFSAAESSLRRALRIGPGLEKALYYLGVTLAYTTRVAEAEACQRRLLSIAPWHEGALLMMNDFLAHEGRFDQAEQLVKRALVVNPNSSSALSALAQLRKMTPADTEWMDRAEELVKIAGPVDQVQLRYAMGKYCDDVGDYDRAFINYHDANRLSKAIANNPYSHDNWTRCVDQLVRVNNPSSLHPVFHGAADSNRPVFIVGMPRSGTSLVEQIIASHPAVFGAGELSYWKNIARTPSTPVFESSLNGEVLSRLAKDYLDHLADLDPDARRVIDKMPDNFICMGLIHAVFPNAKFIHAIRNPIDTCLSIYFQNFSAAYDYSNDLADLAHYYREYHRLMAHWRAILPESSLLDLRYEDLLADQEGWSRRMIEFVGLDWDECCLNYQDTQRRVVTASKWQVRQKIYTSSIGRWRHYEKFIGPLMELDSLRLG